MKLEVEFFDVHKPGHFKCPKCGFYLIQALVDSNMRIVGVDTAVKFNCQIDGTELVAVTWKEHSLNLEKFIKDRIGLS